MNKKLYILCCIFILSFLLTGCGEDTKLTTFQANMENFTNNISKISAQMDAIDPTSESAVSDFLSCLDKMNEQFSLLAQIEIPSKFSNIEDLAKEASNYMTEANSLYHQAYENDSYDEIMAETAAENYSRAMKRMSYISELLQGKIPDGTDVMVTEEDLLDFQPVTEENWEDESIPEVDE